MDTSKLKKMAQYIRRQLIDSISAKLELVLDVNSIERRESESSIDTLEALINVHGKEQVVEKVAYTWFNRFCALRFMEVNKYTKINVISPLLGQFQPEVLAEAKMGYIDENVVSKQDIAKIKGLLNNSITGKDPQRDAYKILMVSYCNYYHKQMPFLFERINDYTELLIPEDLLSGNSILAYIKETLTPDICKDVEVIGWLYQYYISEKKEQIDYELKNNKKRKVQKDDMPAKTQLFTPKWIVRYMVENSVGQLWLESHPDENLKSKFKYYIEPAEQDDDVKQKLEELKNRNLKPQEIKVLDPACGSGHILIVAFSILFEIYKSQGWQENEIPELILRNNLFGLDICDRAAQMAQFAVMMKAREYDKNILNKVSELNICSIKDTHWINNTIVQELMKGVKDKEHAAEQIKLLQETYKDAKEYGSIIDVQGVDFNFWEERINFFNKSGQISTSTSTIRENLPYTLKQAKIMQQKYEAVITNPPYLGSSFFDKKLTEFVKCKYPNSKSDLCVAFIEKLLKMTQKNCYCSLVTMQSWMFLSSFEAFRKNLLNNATITTMTHMGNNVMRIAFGTCATVWKKVLIPDFKATYSWVQNNDLKNNDEPYIFPIKDNGKYNIVKQNGFHSIPGLPIAYWASDRVRDIFKNSKILGDYALSRNGMKTGNNDLFVRFWYEIDINKFNTKYNDYIEASKSKTKWFPYNKGGDFRKWYGNNDFVVNWENSGKKIFYLAKVEKRNVQNYPDELKFKPSVSWSLITSGSPSFRYKECNLSDIAGMSYWPKKSDTLFYLLGLSNTKFTFEVLKLIAPTINFQAGDIARIPVIYADDYITDINNLVKENISISKDDWDSFEISWDFQIHPLLRFSNLSKGLVDGKNIYIAEPITSGDKIEDCFKKWQNYKQEQFNKLKANEEELNRLFIEIYGLQDEMTPDVSDDDLIYFRKADENREIKSLISYAVGCMFGRYSLDREGLIFAGGRFDKSKYITFPADEDAVIPVLAEHLFADDITSRLKEFLKAAFGEKYFDENLEYVAKVLGKKNTETADDTIRSYFMKDFYNDHLKIYQKRPIYWMFSSSKGNFNALVYMHRYNKDTASVILNSYLRNFRDEKLKAKIENCKQIELSASSSQSNKIKAQKQREEMEKIVKEVSDYEHDILYPLAAERKEIDLDDGVKVNYLKFGKALMDFGLKSKDK